MSADPAFSVADWIDALARPAAYAHPVDTVEVHQTHISIVFLAGRFAYKVKKPVNLGFLDFRTLDQRKYFCEEEVRLNRRLAPQVYLDVLPITIDAGRPRFGGTGPAVEWAVLMKRLPGDATLQSRVLRGDIEPETLDRLAQRLAQFHRQADRNQQARAFGRFAFVAHNARENFQQTETHVGVTVAANVFEGVRALTEAQLHQHHDRIEARADRDLPCDTHGDLHLDHVYYFPDESPPDDLVMIDCIEFADRFRYADPVADAAFLVMDLKFHGRRDLARRFADAYFQAAGDADGRDLLPFWSAYRAVIRAKVDGIKVLARELGPTVHASVLARAQAHWLLALGELETPARRPALVIVCGLPGSGKSTLAASLAEVGNFQLLRSDLIRKELTQAAGLSATASGFWEGIYDPVWSERTYREMLTRAERLWWNGERVLVDANFREDGQRQLFLDAAKRWCIPTLFLHCQTDAALVRQRLQARRDDVSDADWNTYQQLAGRWQPWRTTPDTTLIAIDTSGTPAVVAEQVIQKLRQADWI